MTRILFLAILVCLSLPLAAQTTESALASGEIVAPLVATGEWTYQVASPGGGDEGTFVITESDEGELGGVYNARGDSFDLFDISVDGNTLAFAFVFQSGPTVNVSGTVTDGSFDGTADAGGFGAFPMTATHQPE